VLATADAMPHLFARRILPPAILLPSVSSGRQSPMLLPVAKTLLKIDILRGAQAFGFACRHAAHAAGLRQRPPSSPRRRSVSDTAFTPVRRHAGFTPSRSMFVTGGHEPSSSATCAAATQTPRRRDAAALCAATTAAMPPPMSRRQP